ncbi:MAG: response regulator transcription factor [Bacteroidales bacterium]
MKILIVEDEPSLRELMQCVLEKEKYVVEVAQNFYTATEKIGMHEYDCILLDIMLPDGNGLQLLEKIKHSPNPKNVIIISAKNSIEDKVTGLNLGADDYLAKPFHLAELSARIRSIIRRNNQKGCSYIELGNVKILPEQNMITIADHAIEVGRKEYDILYFFMNRPHHLIGKETLAEAVWGDNFDQVDNFDFIYAHIKNIRKKMKEAEATIEIKAVYGFGYKLVTIDSSK